MSPEVATNDDWHRILDIDENDKKRHKSEGADFGQSFRDTMVEMISMQQKQFAEVLMVGFMK